MSKAFMILFICLVISFPGFSQPIPFAKARIWMEQLATSKPDSGRAICMLNLAQYYLLKPGEERSDIDSAFLLTEQSAALSKQAGFRRGQEDAALLRCRIYLELKDEKTLARFYTPLSDSNKLKILLEKGVQYIYDLPGASKRTMDQLCHDAAQVCQAASNPRANCLYDELMGMRCMQMGMIKKGKQHALQCLHYLDANNFIEEADTFCYRILQWARYNDNVDFSKHDYNRETVNFSAFYYERPATIAISAGNYNAALNEYVKWMTFAIGRKDYMNAIDLALKAQQLESHISDSANHFLLNQIATLYYIHGDLYHALLYGRKLVDKIDQRGYVKENDYLAYRLLTEVYSQSGMLPESLGFCKKALANIEQFDKDPKGLDRKGKKYQQLRCIGIETAFLRKTGHISQALDTLQAYDRSFGASSPLCHMIMLMGIAECYGDTAQYDVAEHTFMECLQIAQKNKLGDSISLFLPMAKFYVQKGAFKKARPYIETLLQPMGGRISIFTMREAHALLYRVDSAAGRPIDALSDLRRYKQLNDSIFSTNRNGQIEALQVRYATESKDKDIQSREQHIVFLQKEQEFQKAVLHTAHLIRNMVIAAILLLLLLLALVYNRYRIKQRTNRLLAHQQNLIRDKNELLEAAVKEKDKLLTEKEDLLADKDDLLVEKDWLVKEIHHRVKNNLQIVVSLLNMAGRYIDNEEAARCIKESKDRMHAMSLIHQKLYKSDGTESVDMNDYIRDLVSYLDSNYNTGRRIHFNMSVDTIRLDMALAVPVGLILNEAITNTIKHAFLGSDSGMIRVSLSQEPGSMLRLVVSDNGAGLPSDWEENIRKSMGMNLMKALASQLHGNFSIISKNGVSITILFPSGPDVL